MTPPAMGAFHPTTITLHPPPPDDPRAVALITALNRDLSFRRTMNLPTVLLLGLLSAGVAPLVILLLRFGTFSKAEKFQLEHVTEWIETSEDELELSEATRSLARGPLVTILVVSLTIASLALAVAHAIADRGDVLALWSFYASDFGDPLPVLYVLSVTMAYVALWNAVRDQHLRVARFFHAFQTTAAEHANNSLGRRGSIAPRWPWILCALALLGLGSLWGFAMMLAAGAHRRYMKEINRDLRAGIARRIEEMRGPDAHATGW